MTIETTPVQFKTPDGATFATKEEAERHAELTEAEEAYRAARHAFGAALARTQRTADGELFDFQFWGHFYYVATPYGSPPRIVKVDCPRYNFDYRVDEDDRFYLVDRGVDRDSRREYRISDLYWHQHNAERALLAAQEQWLAEHAEEIAKLRAKLNPDPS